ncbi:MAG TPA: DNA-3-methyladenine glycosylase [Nitrososphaerales archaeon]|nr:DNA-3-methyladenine glycosylase [Nitrososphaerales archaeon]
MERLGRAFYAASSPVVARNALGKVLVRVREGRRLSGIIVETEAYRGSGDPASHAYHGKTRRNEVMFGEPGHAYVYFTYGNHFCLNLTCEPTGKPAAVLVRAIEPMEGIDVMKGNRGVEDVRNLTSGPGKLTKALGIARVLNGEDLVTSARLFLEEGMKPSGVGTSPRVGVTEGGERNWRFFARGSLFLSPGRPSGGSPRTHNYRGRRRG